MHLPPPKSSVDLPLRPSKALQPCPGASDAISDAPSDDLSDNLSDNLNAQNAIQDKSDESDNCALAIYLRQIKRLESEVIESAPASTAASGERRCLA